MKPARPQLGIWVDFLIFVDFRLVFIENVDFGASPARTSVASFPAGGVFFVVKGPFDETHYFLLLFFNAVYPKWL